MHYHALLKIHQNAVGSITRFRITAGYVVKILDEPIMNVSLLFHWKRTISLQA